MRRLLAQSLQRARFVAVKPHSNLLVRNFRRCSVRLNHSGTSPIILDGKAYSKEKLKEIKSIIQEKQKINPGFKPGLAILQVGGRPDSSVYVASKGKQAKSLGMHFKHVHFKEDVAEADVLDEILNLNKDNTIHGMLLQLPIPPHLKPYRIIDHMDPAKDVDGFHCLNIGSLSRARTRATIAPCTPLGVIKMLKSKNIDLVGKHAVVLGRSDVVGSPLISLLLKEDCTVTTCHSKTQNVENLTRQADILIAAIGKPNFVKADMIKEGAIVIDVGINVVEDESTKKGYRLVGDVKYDEVAPKCSAITPVPGGVGPVTVTTLLENTLAAAEVYSNKCHGGWCLSLNPLPDLDPSIVSDLDIAKAHPPLPISDIISDINFLQSEISPQGDYMAKVDPTFIDRLHDAPDGNYIVVAGITPTPLGEGKTTVTMGLTQALGAHLMKNTIACIRQPSMGPLFGIKGGAHGGGKSMVVPIEEFNLHQTGDIHAVTAAHNLMAAAIDARLLHESKQSDKSLFNRLCPANHKNNFTRSFSPMQVVRLQKLGINKESPDDLTEEEKHKFVRLDIDPDRITFRRVMDTNDRFLREIRVGLSPSEKGYDRVTGFDITVASEIMAILALASDSKDMRHRLGDMVFGSNKKGEPLTANDLGVTGSLMVLMKEAMKPTLMQSLEGTPVLIHAGPFANIAHGASSVIADKIALKSVGEDGYVITEAGFGADVGLEKFLNIKCRSSGLRPRCVVLVATIRALKMHGGGPNVTAGKPLTLEYVTENLELVEKGLANLVKHIENIKKFGLNVVVSINSFHTDTAAEMQLVQERAVEAGAAGAYICSHHQHGGAGAVELAEAVVRVCQEPDPDFKFLYDLSASPLDKIRSITNQIYGADGVELSDKAATQLKQYEAQGFGALPICMAKTPLSFSHDPKLKGVPTGFTIPIREVRLSAGAGFLYPLVGDMPTIPGLPTRPAFYDIDYDPVTGEVLGLS